MDQEELTAIQAALRRFAAKVEKSIFSGDGPDGDLSRMPDLLTEARKIGLLADPEPGAPGYEMGVWGRACVEEGLWPSLASLSILGEVCAGFATTVHAQGLGCLALDGQACCPSGTLISAAFTPSYGIPLSARLQSDGSGLSLEHVGDHDELNGGIQFLLAPEEPARIVCFARDRRHPGAAPGWVSLLVAPEIVGVELCDAGQRTGLRACRQYHLSCENVMISPDQILNAGAEARRSLEHVMACNWLGQAAIALGVARRALRDSRLYTAQRYQGGSLIEAHASVQLLQGTSEYDIAVLAALLEGNAAKPLSSVTPVELLRWAVQARLALVEHAHRAVTNCLQTLGGYGYMQEYGFEKRLRDVSVLKSLHGAPDQLKLFLNELTDGGDFLEVR